MTRTLALNYAAVSIVLGGFFLFLTSIYSGEGNGELIDPRALMPAMFLLLLLTAFVWLLMLLARNISVAIGKVSMRYYTSYRDDAPPEWIERPARTFNNLLEVPLLFYVACVLMLAVDHCDQAQAQLAATFVGTRYLHALIYIGVNHVPARFGAYVMGCVTLGVMWTRLAYALL
jgi:hypothetical protein